MSRRWLSGTIWTPPGRGIGLRQETAPPTAPSSLPHWEFLGWQMVGAGGLEASAARDLRDPVPSRLSSSVSPTPHLLCSSRSFPG